MPKVNCLGKIFAMSWKEPILNVVRLELFAQKIFGVVASSMVMSTLFDEKVVFESKKYTTICFGAMVIIPSSKLNTQKYSIRIWNVSFGN